MAKLTFAGFHKLTGAEMVFRDEAEAEAKRLQEDIKWLIKNSKGCYGVNGFEVGAVTWDDLKKGGWLKALSKTEDKVDAPTLGKTIEGMCKEYPDCGCIYHAKADECEP